MINHSKTGTVLLVFIIAAFITSCEFEPKGRYWVELTKPTEIPPIDVDLNLIADTVYFYWETPVNLKINTGNLEVLYVKFYLDNNAIEVVQDGTKYSAVLYFSEPGVHKFKITIFTHTGSNSLADILGSEGFKYESNEWTLIARNLTTGKNLSYEIINNELIFSWKEYDGLNFKSYRLKERATGNVFNVQTNYYHHSTYSGGQSDYDLYVVDNTNKEYAWGSCYISKNLPVLKLAAIENRIALTWNKPVFKDNIKELQVFQSDLSYNWIKIATLTTSDTSIFINTPENVFCPWLNFYLYCIPKQYVQIEYTSNFSSYLEYVHAALPGPSFINDIHISCSGFYFREPSPDLGRDVVYKYSIADDSVITLLDYNYYCDISPNAKYLLNPGNSVLDLYDLNTDSIIRSVDIKLFAPGFYPSDYPKISDNGICTFVSQNILYVYDILNDQLITSNPMEATWPKISPNGRYLSVRVNDSLKIYRINISSVAYLSGMKIPSGLFSYTNYNFFPDNDDKIYIFDEPNLYIRSSGDLSAIRRMDIGPWLYNIDFCSCKIFTARDAISWNIYDLNTGDLLHAIKSEIGSGAENFTLLTNNTIYYTGYKYFLGN